MNIGGSRLLDLQMLGQSVWLECSHPRTLASSTLTHLIRAGISGIDTNPSSLAAAYADDVAYHAPAMKLRAAGATMQEIVERLRIEDALHLADRLRRVHDCTGGLEGYASVDVSSAVADDAAGIESEARRLWSVIGRPNVMIKVPATDAGLVAIRACIAAGLNVNATGIFGARRYAAVHDAFLSGLQDRLAAGLPLEGVASVASIMIGRIDDAIDAELDAIVKPLQAARATRLRHRAAVAVAQFVFQHHKSVLSSPRWQVLAAHRAQKQRLLWAGTEINAGDDGDLKYVNPLVGRDTVAAMSPETLQAYLDHGAAAPTLERNLHQVLELFGALEALGINLDRVSAQLERARIRAIAASVDTALTRLFQAA